MENSNTVGDAFTANMMTWTLITFFLKLYHVVDWPWWVIFGPWVALTVITVVVAVIVAIFLAIKNATRIR